jgi:ribulose-phosphate 3-epimerase
MFGTVQIAPSLLSADFLNLERDVRLIEQGHPEWLHVDVMDGHFVPNLTIGPPIVAALKQLTNIPLDVHLMISNPAAQLDWFLEAGANLVTVHIECGGGAVSPAHTAGTPAHAAGAAGGGGVASMAGTAVRTTSAAHTAGTSPSIERVDDPSTLIDLIDRIHASGARAGVALNPGTPAAAVNPFIALVDLVLVMSVHPGFGGQSFIASSVDKLTQISAFAHAAGANPLLEIDGGINAQTAPLATAQGADVLVAGNAIFATPNPVAALRALRAASHNKEQ